MHTILSIEDDPQVRKVIARALSNNYRVISCASLAEAETELTRCTPSLILLDVSLPDGEGFGFCAKLRVRPEFANIQVIFLTGHVELSHKVTGLSVGADDYMTKPFDILELRARVEARMRRIEESRRTEREIRIADLHLASAYQRASLQSADGRETSIELTPLEFKILFFFAEHEEQVLSRDQIMEEVWGKNVHVTHRVVDTHLSNVRKKLSSSALTILSIHGVGYKLCRREQTKKKPAA